jgi:hypothetical protein
MLNSLVIHFNDSSASFKGSKLSQYPNVLNTSDSNFLPKDEQLEKYYCFGGPDGLSRLLPIGDYYYLIVGRLNKSGRTYIYLRLSFIDKTESPRDHFYSIVIE